MTTDGGVWPRNLKTHLVILVVLSAVFMTVSWFEETEWYGSDALQNMTMAYHFNRQGVFSVDRFEVENPQPSAYRPPAYPFFLSLALRLSPTLSQAGPDFYWNTKNLPHFQYIIALQRALHLVASLMIMGFAWYLVRSVFAAYLAFALTATDFLTHSQGSLFTPETFVMFFLVILSISLYFAVKKQSPGLYILAGVALGVLAVTRGHFEYLAWPLFLLMLLVWFRAAPRRGWALVGIVLFAVLALGPPLAWKARNNHHFGRWYLTDRGGMVLDIRANFLDVNTTEYFTALLYWFTHADGDTSMKFLGVPKENYVRISRSEGGPLCFYEQAKAERARLQKKYGNTYEADQAQKKAALDKIKSRPLKHLALCLPFAERGMNVHRLWLVPFFLFFTFFYMLVRCWRARDWPLAFFLLPSFISFGLLTLMTHNLNRYNQILLPILYIAMLLWFYRNKRPIHQR